MRASVVKFVVAAGLILAAAVIGGMLLLACGGSKQTPLSALSDQSDSFVAWDLDHQRRIVASAKTEQEGIEMLRTYREKQTKVVAAFDAAVDALEALNFLLADLQRPAVTP